MDKLHSAGDNQIERRDQVKTARAMVWALVAMAVFFAVALLVLYLMNVHRRSQLPNPGQTTHLVRGMTGREVA